MSDQSEKLSAVISLRLSETFMERLRDVSKTTGLRVPEIARNAIYDEVERLERAKGDPDIAALLDRCRSYQIDIKTVLHTALIEEQCSSIKSYGNKTTAAA